MNTNITRLIVALLCAFTISTGCSKPEAVITPDKPFNGAYYFKNATILLKESEGIAIVADSGSTSLRLNDTFLQITERTGSNSWKASVYDENLTRRLEGNITLGTQLLTVNPKDASSYTLSAVATASGSSGNSSGSSTSGSSSGSGCSSVQCSGTTQDGDRCKRKTTNCNGRCYQH